MLSDDRLRATTGGLESIKLNPLSEAKLTAASSGFAIAITNVVRGTIRRARIFSTGAPQNDPNRALLLCRIFPGVVGINDPVPF